MVVLTPRFATLLLLVATSQAAFVPQRPGSEPQVHFHSRSTSGEPSSFDYVRSFNPFRNMLLLRRGIPPSSNSESAANTSVNRKTKGKGRGRFGAASVFAPIPNSAKPVSKKVSHNGTVVNHKPSIATPLKAAELSEDVEGTLKHSEGQHHRNYHSGWSKGHKGKHFTGQNDETVTSHKGEESMGGHRGHGSEESKDRHNRHEDKRELIDASVSITRRHTPKPRVNSRLFARIGDDLPTRYYAARAVHDHDHAHDHVHEHIHDHAHDHDHDKDNDHDHDHDKDHDHNRRDLSYLLDHIVGPDFEGDASLETRGLHGSGRHHARDWDDEYDLLDIDAYLGRRGYRDARLPRDQTKPVLQVRKHYPLVIHDNHHEHTTYHVHGKRDHRRDHEHEHEHERIHKHIHSRRDSIGVPGSIQIVSPTAGGKPIKIANLVLTGVHNSTESSPQNASFVLNASNDTQTQVFLVASDSTPTNGISLVTLQVPMFDRATVKDVPYCVTYDPNPSGPGPLAVKQCRETSAHQSQLFKFSTADGSVRPIWESEDGEASEVASQAAEQQSPFERESIANEAAATDFAITKSTTPVNSTSAAPVSTVSNTTQSAAKGTMSPPQSVALIFEPDDPQAPKVASEDISPSNTTTSSSPQAARNTTLSSSSALTTSTGTASSSSAVAQDVRVASTSTISDALSTQASTRSTSSTGASAAAVTSTSSTSVASSSPTSSTSPTKVLAAAVTSTSSDTSPTNTAAVRAADAAAPYEWMFTPRVQN